MIFAKEKKVLQGMIDRYLNLEYATEWKCDEDMKATILITNYSFGPGAGHLQFSTPFM